MYKRVNHVLLLFLHTSLSQYHVMNQNMMTVVTMMVMMTMVTMVTVVTMVMMTMGRGMIRMVRVGGVTTMCMIRVFM